MARDRLAFGWDALPIILLFLVLRPARAAAVAMIPPHPGKGITPTAAVKTGGATWKADRFAALATKGIAGELARSIVAHWAFETGWGIGEFNFNVGNRMARAGETGHHLDDGGGPGWYKSYATLDDGVADYLALLASARYATAWALLQANPTDSAWIHKLVESGYATLAPDEYERRYVSVRARV